MSKLLLVLCLIVGSYTTNAFVSHNVKDRIAAATEKVEKLIISINKTVIEVEQKSKKVLVDWRIKAAEKAQKINQTVTENIKGAVKKMDEKIDEWAGKAVDGSVNVAKCAKLADGVHETAAEIISNTSVCLRDEIEEGFKYIKYLKDFINNFIQTLAFSIKNAKKCFDIPAGPSIEACLTQFHSKTAQELTDRVPILVEIAEDVTFTMIHYPHMSVCDMTASILSFGENVELVTDRIKSCIDQKIDDSEANFHTANASVSDNVQDHTSLQETALRFNYIRLNWRKQVEKKAQQIIRALMVKIGGAMKKLDEKMVEWDGKAVNGSVSVAECVGLTGDGVHEIAMKIVTNTNDCLSDKMDKVFESVEYSNDVTDDLYANITAFKDDVRKCFNGSQWFSENRPKTGRKRGDLPPMVDVAGLIDDVKAYTCLTEAIDKAGLDNKVRALLKDVEERAFEATATISSMSICDMTTPVQAFIEDVGRITDQLQFCIDHEIDSIVMDHAQRF